MQLHNIKRKTKNKKKVQVGRGGTRGKTSGRGTKGQKARAGRKLRPEMREIIKKLPKLRGYAFNTIQVRPVVISLQKISAVFENGGDITPEILISNKVANLLKGNVPKIKIVGPRKDFVFEKKINVTGVVVTPGAKATIEKAGGSVK